jgi:transposase
MPNRCISDLKDAMLRLENRGRDTTAEVLKIAQFSRSTLYRARKQKRETGSVARAQAHGRGRPRTLAELDADYLVRLAKHKPTMFLDEYRERLERYRNLSASLATIHRTFIRARMSLKRVQKMASERCPLERANYSRHISIYPTSYLISIDEVSKDDRTYAHIFGRSEIGLRAEAAQPFVRKRRLTGVAALALGKGIIGAKVVEGSLC